MDKDGNSEVTVEEFKNVTDALDEPPSARNTERLHIPCAWSLVTLMCTNPPTGLGLPS